MALSAIFRPNVAKLRERGDVRGLVRALDASQASDRKAAYQALVQLEGLAVEELCAALRDKPPGLREQAARALGEIGDARAAGALSRALREDAASAVRAQAASSLSSLARREDAALLVAALADDEAEVRQAARQALVRIGTPAVPALQDGLHSANGIVRALCVWALAEIAGPGVFDGLCAALRDPEWAIRNNAVIGLGELGDQRALRPLVNSLRDRDLHVRAAAAVALRRVGDGSILAEILRLATSLPPGDDTREARITFIELADLWNLGAVQRELESANPAIRKAALEILLKRHWNPYGGTPQQQAIFWAMLHQWQRCAQLGEVAIGPLVEQLAEAQHAEVHFAEVQNAEAHAEAPYADRISIIHALGQLGSPHAIAPLVRQCILETTLDPGGFPAREPNWQVVRAVVEALFRIGPLAADAFHTIAIQLKQASNVCKLGEMIANSLNPGDAQLHLVLLERGEPFAEFAGRALEELADPHTLQPLLKLYPQDQPFFFIRLLGKIGDAQSVELLAEISSLASAERKRESALHALAECAHWQACQPILEIMFGLRGTNTGLNVWQEHVPQLKQLFGDGIELILRAAAVGTEIDYDQSTYQVIEDGQDTFTRAAYVRRVKVDMPAVEELCRQANPLTDNLLQILAAASNRWLKAYGSHAGWEKIITLKTRVEEELEKRGYPAYDTKIYMRPHPWLEAADLKQVP